jgi:hypothetical protein
MTIASALIVALSFGVVLIIIVALAVTIVRSSVELYANLGRIAGWLGLKDLQKDIDRSTVEAERLHERMRRLQESGSAYAAQRKASCSGPARRSTC